MRVLILDHDLHREFGPDQSFYVKLIENLPDVEFYYFGCGELLPSNPPQNVRVIPFERHYKSQDDHVPPDLRKLYHLYVECANYALLVKNFSSIRNFDYVDVPDYAKGLGIFVKSAFHAQDVHVNNLVLALHGSSSSKLTEDWAPGVDNSGLFCELIDLEHVQYKISDTRYAFSDRYAAEWEHRTGIASRVIDPVTIAGDFTSSRIDNSEFEIDTDEAADLVFIGTRDKVKAPDLFIDLAWAVGEKRFRRLRLIGNESASNSGATSQSVLSLAAELRDLAVEYMDPVPSDQVREILTSRSVVVLPSRVDTFNLVAMEALRVGCPVLVSRQAGVSHWIEATYPDLRPLIIDIDCSRSAATQIRDVLDNYYDWRRRIKHAIDGRPLTPATNAARRVYIPVNDGDHHLQSEYMLLGRRFNDQYRPRFHHPTLRQAPALKAVSLGMKGLSPTSALSEAERFPFSHIVRHFSGLFQNTLGICPQSRSECEDLIRVYSEAAAAHRFGRVAIFEQLAMLETVRGQSLTAALYRLRIGRWTGSLAQPEISEICKAFRSEGFDKEAEVVWAMYQDADLAHARSLSFISHQSTEMKHVGFDDFEFVDERRSAKVRKVSVICSLYNAAAKLSTLLRNLASQDLARDDEVEIILIDSGSPGDDYAAFLRAAENLFLPIVYARSLKRETIQAAWNRGIKLSRSHYLCFYGADEGMHPDCLRILSRTLDDYPDVHWVMSDSIMTEVDKNGVFTSDLVRFRRHTLSRGAVYLDTTYLSWVGGLYRRSIHDTLGYYDPTFRAAGDTEFKSRVLRNLNLMHIEKPLGVFNNYPEERTTAHPRAEIEDQRAWYLHRTRAGIDNLFGQRDISEAERLLKSCFGYRKTYLEKMSTDFDLALMILDHIEARDGNHEFVGRGRAVVCQALGIMNVIETLDLRQPAPQSIVVLEGCFEQMLKLENEAQAALALSQRPVFRVLNDNRFEQHWWSWSSS